MRFGHFFYPMNFDPSRDSQTIDECLDEAELVEQLGFDAIWIAEHHFVGEAVYGDALLFGAAVAVKTRRVLIGLGVVEMALHNPVQLAIQTALLDNLSHGRLVVGTGRGSNYNAFEYIDFGTSVEAGLAQLPEAEELLVKAWTTEGLDYQGDHWQVSFPAVRPRPYQKPHPPLARACLSPDSITAMARLGRPVLLRGRSVDHLAQIIQLYRDAMLEADFPEVDVEHALDQSWIWLEIHMAETDAQALDEFLPKYHAASQYIADMREQWNPKDQPLPKPPPPLPASSYDATPSRSTNEVLIGSPRRVAEQMALLRDAGARNLMLTNRGIMSPEQTQSSLTLLSEHIMPKFR